MAHNLLQSFFEGLVAGHGEKTTVQQPETPNAGEHRSISFRQKGRPVGYRATKTVKRRTTIHLDHDVAERLSAYCQENDLIMSHVVSQGMRSWLNFLCKEQ